MRWSLRLGQVAGIQIYMHWTFLILIGWIFLIHLQTGRGMGYALQGVAFVLALFGCVVLHELGHALTARRYDIPTRDITLLPIGGVARLERMPREPMAEFWVAIAGPAVNVVIAIGLYLLLHWMDRFVPFSRAMAVGGGFLAQLMWTNLILVVFNMLPAFPMDGGRVLRALLAQRMDYAKATRIAARIGQGMAILFGFLGFFKSPILLFIALFVFLGADQEAHMVETTSSLRGLTVRDAMMTRFRALYATDPVSVAVSELIAGSQVDFPVLDPLGRVVGLLTRNQLVKALSEGRLHAPVGEVMTQGCPVVDEDEPLEGVYELLRQGPCSSLPVVRGGRLVGLLTLENIGEWVMVNNAIRQATRART